LVTVFELNVEHCEAEHEMTPNPTRPELQAPTNYAQNAAGSFT